MKRWVLTLGMAIILVLTACNPVVKTPQPTSTQPTLSPPTSEIPSLVKETTTPTPTVETGKLTPTPVETSKPIYGGTLSYATKFPASFDLHKNLAYAQSAAMPVFNQLIIYSLDYEETVPENLVGDLADSWALDDNGTAITFKLHQGVKWHDGVSFTADDVVYSLDKMTDPLRSSISARFPAYQSSEKIDDYTVKIHLKYPSFSFLTAMAEGEAVIEPEHLAGTDDQSVNFLVGTGPFKVGEYLSGVHLEFTKNPDYFKKDSAGNQLPYLGGLTIYSAQNQTVNDLLVSRRIDFRGATAGVATLSSYDQLTQGAPEMLWQKLDLEFSTVLYLNVTHKPLDDIRVRQALGLVINESDLIIGFAGDEKFGEPDTGLINPSLGLPKDEVRKLMGWDKPFEERVAKAQQLMIDAGYPDGFKMNILSDGGTTMTEGGLALVYADALKKYLKIDATVNIGLGQTEIYKRRAEGNFDLYASSLRVERNPVQMADYVSTGGAGNYSRYSNPEVDNILSGLDRVFDPAERRAEIWQVERTLLTDLPMLPTGTFIGNLMPYYPWVKNLRWINMRYSNLVRFEDVWIDQSIARQEPVIETTPPPSSTPPPATTTAPPATSDNGTPPSYDRPDIPIVWVSIDPPEAIAKSDQKVTIKMKVPPGAYVYLIYILPKTGTRSTYSHDEKVADANGDITLSFSIFHDVYDGMGTLEATVKDGTTKAVIGVVTHPYLNKAP